MSKVFGTRESVIIEDSADSSGELEIGMAIMADDHDSESVDDWINKDDAIRLIEHLQKVFGLNLGEL